MRFLVCTDGTPVGAQALAFAAPLARAAGATVTVLGVAPEGGAEAPVRAALDGAAEQWGSAPEARLRHGRLASEILAEAQAGGYDLIVAGSRGRRGLTRLAFGSVAAQLARYAPIPALLVKGPARPALRRILACTGGDVRGERVARWAGRLAGWTGAAVTILHVMSQIPISAHAKFDELEMTAEEAVALGTREGQHLARALALVGEEAGAGAPAARPKLRQGLVVEAVAAEAEAGDYDLVILGAHEAPELPANWEVLEFLLEDVADQLLMAIQRPVLIVKGR